MDQDHPKVIVLPPIAFFTAVVLTFALGRWLSLGVLSDIPRLPLVVVGVVVMAAALLISVTGIFAFKRAGTNVNPYQPSLSIVSDGPYRFTRNPMYLGMILFVLGSGITMATLWGLIVACLLWAFLDWGVVRPEENYLTEKFGDEYSKLLSSTRRWL